MEMGRATRRSQVLLLALGLSVSAMMIVMGVIREGSRDPYLIHGQMTIDHQEIVTNPGPPSSTEQTPAP
jgi:hypothetical protein